MASRPLRWRTPPALETCGQAQAVGHRPWIRRAAYSIGAAAKIFTIAATVACTFTGSTTVGFGGQLIKIISRVSYGLMSWTTKRSTLVT